MALKLKTKPKPGAGSATSSAAMLEKYKAKYGERIGSMGVIPEEVERIPTGVFPFDLATGGGIPRGRVTIIYGPESSCKTNVALKAAAANQRLYPEEKVVWIAIEPFDSAWAAKMGLDLSEDRLIVLYPSLAEEAIDMAENFLQADDVGMVIIDSLAAIITTQEAEKDAFGNTQGGASIAIGKLVRRTTLALREKQKSGLREPSLIYISQTRTKIGVMYGDPETMPGGNAPRFQAALWVRVYGKNIKDPKVSDTYPVRKEVRFVIKKNKLPILADTGEFEMVMYPHNGLKIGETDDGGTIIEYLKGFGQFEKNGSKGYLILGEGYPTQKAFLDRIGMDRKFGAEVRQAIITKTLLDKEGELIVQDGSVVDADGVVAED